MILRVVAKPMSLQAKIKAPMAPKPTMAKGGRHSHSGEESGGGGMEVRVWWKRESENPRVELFPPVADPTTTFRSTNRFRSWTTK